MSEIAINYAFTDCIDRGAQRTSDPTCCQSQIATQLRAGRVGIDQLVAAGASRLEPRRCGRSVSDAPAGVRRAAVVKIGKPAPAARWQRSRPRRWQSWDQHLASQTLRDLE